MSAAKVKRGPGSWSRSPPPETSGNGIRYLDGRQAVLYHSRMNPSLGRKFEALDPLEWLARMSDHIPDPGRP